MRNPKNDATLRTGTIRQSGRYQQSMVGWVCGTTGEFYVRIKRVMDLENYENKKAQLMCAKWRRKCEEID